MVRRLLGVLTILILTGGGQAAQADQITLASTTSTENSGLFAHLLPLFEVETGIQVRVIAVGTGQAIRLARNGDADVLLTHHRESEERFVADGFGVRRLPVMYNDFVIVGPAADPARVGTSETAADALGRIARAEQPFASRGDESGTHRAEISLWARAGGKPATRQNWYREMGSGMGATLNAAVAMGAYTLSDRATWTSFANKGGHRILFESDPALFNQYAVIRVNPERHPHVKAGAAKRFIDWLISAEGQAAIASFRLAGRQVFFPNARRLPKS
ncbi:substrate-binding domain-containing protein [Minwuia sp.]|uniref:substrate-binding domain-containing protein n=1 Tax=Minwuia sp. TaxID=2493630 RepID=UPI003A8DE683